MQIKSRLLIAGVLTFLLFGATLLVAQTDKTVEKVLTLAAKDNQTMEHLDVLVNRIGGRFIGSDNYQNAVNWTAHKFREWGLDVEVIEVGTLNVGFNRGPWFGRMLCDTDGMTLHFATPSYTSGTKGRQRGHVLAEPKSQQEFDRMKGALKGAWVLISGENTGSPIDYSPQGDSLREIVIKKNNEIAGRNTNIARWNRENPDSIPRKAEPLEDVPALFYKQMREVGILGIIQSSRVPILALSDRKNLINGTMTFDNLPTVPDIKLSEHQYRIIEQKVKERRYFQLEFDIRNHFKMGPVKYYNVIASIKGTKYPNEYVMCGGHLDSYDVATGGVDCGTGVAPTMEAARLLALSGAKPKRTIVFCLWAGEEAGLLGSKHWVETNKDKWSNIINYFNRDGGPTVANSITVPSSWVKDMEQISAPLNKFNPEFPFTVIQGEPRQRPRTPGGSDHAYFALNGVPTISFGTADPKGYNFSYPEIWHTERDTYDKSIPEYMNHTSVVNAVILWGMANLERKLPAKDVYRAE
jgi:hypothetical protein